jgi:hypothetical protein
MSENLIIYKTNVYFKEFPCKGFILNVKIN